MTIKNQQPALTFLSLALAGTSLAQTAVQARDPILINAPDCGSCFCTMQLGQSGPISTPNNDNDLVNKFNPLQHFQYKSVNLWSKGNYNQGVKLQMTNPGFQGGTGTQADTKTTFGSVTGLQLATIKLRFSVQSPYQFGCNLRLTMDDGHIFQDASNSVGNLGCTNYAEETAVFNNNQFVFSFFSYSDNTITLKSPSYLGINYYQCLCRNLQISIPTLQNMEATVLGQSQSQSIVLDYGLFDCTPIVLTISPAVNWLTYTFQDPSLTITIGSSNIAEISINTFAVTAYYDTNVPVTAYFQASILACKVSSIALVSGVTSFQYTITPSATLVTKTPTFTLSPSCPGISSTLSVTTNTSAPFIQVYGGSIQISTSDRTLNNQNVLVTYVYTANQQSEVAVVGIFVVSLYSPCSAATISGTIMSAMSHMVFDLPQNQSGSYSDSYSTQTGQQNYCGALKSQITSTQIWVSSTGSISIEVQTDDINQVGSHSVSYSVYLEDFPLVTQTFTVQVSIDSTCPNTIINQQSLQSMQIQVGSQQSQVFQQFTDVLSLFHGDGLSYCQQRVYTILPVSSFMNLQGTELILSSLSSSDKGQFAFSLIVGLLSFPTVPTISVPFQVEILDCINGIISEISQFTPTSVSILGTFATQSILVSDDNFQLCGSYNVTLASPQPWLIYTYHQNLLTATVKVTDRTTLPSLYQIQWLVQFSSYPNPLQTINWNVNIVECVVDSLSAATELQLFQNVPLFIDYRLQLPLYLQSPQACQYQVEYLATDIDIVDSSTGLISIQISDRNLVDNQFSIAFQTRTLSATPVYSLPLTITFKVTNGCQFTELQIGNISNVTLDQGQEQEIDVSVGDSVSGQYSGFCGDYEISLADSSQSFILIQGNKITVMGQKSGKFQVGLQFSLSQYSSVENKTAYFWVQVNQNFQMPVYPTMANLTEEFSLEVGLKQWHYWFPKASFANAQPAHDDVDDSHVVNVTVQVPTNGLIREVRRGNQIGLELVLPIEADFLGRFKVHVFLSIFDSQMIKRQTQYKINFSIVQIEAENKFKYEWAPDTSEGNNSAKIRKLDSTGLLVLEFTEPVLLNETFKAIFDQQLQLGNPVIDFKVIPGALSDPLNLNFEWSLTSVENSTLSFQIIFLKPAYVSSEANYPDKLLIILRHPDVFLSTLNHSLETRYLSKELKTQWSTSMSMSAAAITTSLQSSMAVAITQNIVLNLILGGSLDSLWSLVEGIQIILHSLLLNISIPQNALTFVTVFMNVASFNLLPTNLITDKIFIEQATDPYSENFNALGYQSLSPIKNMGLLIFLVCFYCLNQIVWITTQRFLPSRFKKMRTTIQNNAFGQNFIRFIMEASLEVSVSYFLYLKHSTAFPISVTATASFFFSIVVLCPIVHCYYFIQKRKLLQSESFSQVEKVYLQFLNLKAQIPAFCYWVVFSGRRILLALICTSSQCLGIQLLLIVIIQYLVSFYIGFVQPFNDKNRNIAEIRSELIITFFLVLLHSMTNFVLSAETRQLMGFVFSSCFCAYLAANIFQMFLSSTQRSIILLKRWQVQRRQRYRVRGKKGPSHVIAPQQVAALVISRAKRPIEAYVVKSAVTRIKSQDGNDAEVIDRILLREQEQQEFKDVEPIDAHRAQIKTPQNQNDSLEQFGNVSKDLQSFQKQPIIRRQPIITDEQSERSLELSQVRERRDSNVSSSQQWQRRSLLSKTGTEIVSSHTRSQLPKPSTFASKFQKAAMKQNSQIQTVTQKANLQSDEITDLELNDFIRRTNIRDPAVFKVLVNGHEVGGALRC